LEAVSTPPRRRKLAVALLLAAVAAAAGCGGDDDVDTAGGTIPLFGGTLPPDGPAIDLTPDGPVGGRDVVVIGDSITVGSAPLIVAAAEAGDVDVTVLAEVGRRITVGNRPSSGSDVVREVFDAGDPDLVVVALGTNDVGKYTTIEEYAAQIQEFLALVPADTPVAWINTYLSRTEDDSAAFNAALLDTMRQRGNATIGRWSSIAQRDGMLRDGVHPSDEGAQEFADLVVEQIDNWLGSSPRPASSSVVS
jgi:lysophospholipase L1-like esterase